MEEEMVSTVTSITAQIRDGAEANTLGGAICVGTEIMQETVFANDVTVLRMLRRRGKRHSSKA